MKRNSFNLILAALALSSIASAAVAQTATPATTPTIVGPVGAVETLAINGKVAAIEPAKRIVTVQGDKGQVLTMHVGPDVKNFDNLKQGDLVAIRYAEARSLAIAKGGINDSQIRVKVEADAAKQVSPNMPGMTGMERTTIVANVFNIDRERGVLTLRGTDGVPVDIRVHDKQMLQQINKDDQLIIGYAQAAAIAIEPAKR